jgi:hypothetical protein
MAVSGGDDEEWLEVHTEDAKDLSVGLPRLPTLEVLADHTSHRGPVVTFRNEAEALLHNAAEEDRHNQGEDLDRVEAGRCQKAGRRDRGFGDSCAFYDWMPLYDQPFMLRRGVSTD